MQLPRQQQMVLHPSCPARACPRLRTTHNITIMLPWQQQQQRSLSWEAGLQQMLIWSTGTCRVQSLSSWRQLQVPTRLILRSRQLARRCQNLSGRRQQPAAGLSFHSQKVITIPQVHHILLSDPAATSQRSRPQLALHPLLDVSDRLDVVQLCSPASN